VKYTLEFPPGVRLINANGRSSKYAVSASSRWGKKQVTSELRAMGCKLARKARIPRLEAVHVTVIYYPPDNRKRDSSNVLFYSSKAGLDGCTDAKIWSDDNDKVVRSLTLIPGDYIVPKGQMVIIIEAEE